MFVKIRCDYNQTLSKFNDSFLMRAKLDSQEPFKSVRYSSTGLALMNLSQTKLSGSTTVYYKIVRNSSNDLA